MAINHGSRRLFMLLHGCRFWDHLLDLFGIVCFIGGSFWSVSGVALSSV
jgi:hypothetical protein